MTRQRTDQPQSTTERAELIRRQLEEAQRGGQRAEDSDANLDEPIDSTIRATKDGQIIPPGEPVPTGPDGNPKPFSVVPTATFHGDFKTAGDELVIIDSQVARQLLEGGCRSDKETAWALFGPSHGRDVLAAVETPIHAERSRTHVVLDGVAIDQFARPLLESHPDWEWLGSAHVHFALDRLSALDMRQVGEWKSMGRIGSKGILMMLVNRIPGRDVPELLAWTCPSSSAAHRLAVVTADNVVDVRRVISGLGVVPRIAPSILAEHPGARRLKEEVEELERGGYTVRMGCVRGGVDLRLEHEELRGVLVLTVPHTGWLTPPRVVHEYGANVRPILWELSSFFAAWSSCFSLETLVSYVRFRRVWPAKKGADAEPVAPPQIEAAS